MVRTTTLIAALVAAGCVGKVGNAGDGDDRSTFEQQIVPIFEQDCGTGVCHAAEGDRFDELDPSYFVFPVDDEGRITGSERIEKAFERAIEKLSGEGAQFGDLVRKPLDESLGGLAHRGGSQYRTMGDPNLEVLMAWAEEAAPDEPEPLGPLADRYRREVQPILAEKRCMLSSCHGASASNLLSFDPGVLGEFDAHATMRNYRSVAFHLGFESPDPMLSRLIRKTVPQDQGGIFHRGGNDFFRPDEDDEDLETILRFITDARAELGDDDKGELQGVAFVATDPTPRDLFEISTWQPGGDLYTLIPAAPDGTLTNLTAAHHTGPVDIRDPAVSHDGTRIAFAMRRSEDDCLNLYVIDTGGGAPVQITHDTGTLPDGSKIANVEPLWGPDDRIYFVSTRSGTMSSHAPVPLSNIYRIDADGSNPVRMTFNPANEIAPGWRFFPAEGHEGPEVRTLDLTFTAVRKVGGELHAPLMRVPPDFRADYHPHFGTQHPDYRIFTQMTQLPDQRESLLLVGEDTVWEGGALALIDRNLGPVIKDGLQPAVVNYVDPLVTLGAIGEEVRHQGYSPDGYYRDPHAAPDGTILVSHSSEPIDLADPAAAPDPALYRLTLLDLPGNQVVVSRKELLVDVAGKVETDPRPIVRKRREEVGDPLHHLSNDVDHGDVLNFDLAVALTVAREDSPSGQKRFDAMAEQIRYVRLVEELPADPDAPPGRVYRGMRRVLAEFPAHDDQSMYVRVPAGIPFVVQALDESRAATTTFNQWFWVLPGEKLKQVTRREVWNTRCGGCHGSKSGVPGDTVATPDVITEASLVAANYDRDTRTDLPPEPFGLGGERIEVDFERDVQPILDAGCATAGCHVAGGQDPDLRARAGTTGFSGSYEALTATGTRSGNGYAYVDPRGATARSSYLAELLVGHELSAPGSVSDTTCPGGQSLSAEQIATLMRWMDLGASYRGTAPIQTPELPTY